MADAARDLRYARWLLERYLARQPKFHGLANLYAARAFLWSDGGDYLPDEARLFAQLQAESEAQMDLWADLKASDR